MSTNEHIENTPEFGSAADSGDAGRTSDATGAGSATPASTEHPLSDVAAVAGSADTPAVTAESGAQPPVPADPPAARPVTETPQTAQVGTPDQAWSTAAPGAPAPGYGGYQPPSAYQVGPGGYQQPAAAPGYGPQHTAVFPPVPAALYTHPAPSPWASPSSRPVAPLGAAAPHAPQPAPEASRTPERKGRRTALVAASTVILALGAGIGGGYLGADLHERSTDTVAAPADASVSEQPTRRPVVLSDEDGISSVQAVADALLPSVVSVVAAGNTGAGEGSGVVLTEDGMILTNNHVIEGAADISVRFNDGSIAKAKIIGTDSTDDLAVIKAQGVTGLTPATIGSSKDIKVGEQVIAIGSPLGLSATVTTGIVSALNRPVRTASAESQQQQIDPYQYPYGVDPYGRGPQQQEESQPSAAATGTVLNAIQTDAAINPGNSGGALVNMRGEVIGINSAIATLSASSSRQGGSIGVGFAIPIDQAYRIAQEIMETGTANYALLGATVGDYAATSTSISSGARIRSVAADGAAEKAGLKVDDVITKIDDQIIESADALVASIRSSVPGGTVDMTILRGTTSLTVPVTLGSATAS